MQRLVGTAILLGLILTGGCTGGAQRPVKLSPEVGKEMTAQGQELVSKGRLEEAQKILQQLTESDQVNAKALVLFGITRYQQKDLNSALDAYNRAIGLDPTFADAYQGKANVYRDQKNLMEAEVWYRKAWQVNPKYLDAYTELAIQLNLANRTPEAINVLKEAITNLPAIVDLPLMLASYYVETGHKDLARETFQDVLKAHPNNQVAKNGIQALQ